MKSASLLYNNINMDLCGDMEEIARSTLIARGIDKDKVAILSNPLKTLIEHDIFSIPTQKRKSVYSKEFQCPAGYEKALSDLNRKIEMGEDINPFLSTRREYADAKDALLFDWGIHHLHLTRRYNSKGRPMRSDYLLFVYCTDSTMYFIQAYRHDSNPFVRDGLLKIIACNWPNILRRFRIDDGYLIKKIDNKDRTSLRKSHVLSLTEIDGKIYFPPGGGYASDGSAVWAVQKADNYWNQVKLMELWLIKNQSFIRSELMRFIPKKRFVEALHFKLYHFSFEKISIFELENHILIEYNLSRQICKLFFLDTVSNIFIDNNYYTGTFCPSICTSYSFWNP